MEHLGVVVGDTFDAFVEAHKPVLTGQQFQGPNSTPDPVYILFEDFTHVKFYRLSLRASVELDGGRVRGRVPPRRRLGARSGSSRRPARTRCRGESTERQYPDRFEVPNGYCPNHASGVKLPSAWRHPLERQNLPDG